MLYLLKKFHSVKTHNTDHFNTHKITDDLNTEFPTNITPEKIICDIAEHEDNNLQHFYQQTFHNQKKFGIDCCNHLLNGKKAVWAIAPTQSGKTGSMISLAFHASKHNIFSYLRHILPKNGFYKPETDSLLISKTEFYTETNWILSFKPFLIFQKHTILSSLLMKLS